MIVNIFLTYEGKLVYWLGNGENRAIDLYPPVLIGDCWRVFVYQYQYPEEDERRRQARQFSRFREAVDFYFISLGDEDIEFEYRFPQLQEKTLLVEQEIPKPTNITNRKLQLP